MKTSAAFDVCHEIYRAARELVDSRLPTMQLASVSKFSWRPNVHPRLVEYVADFALAGERALAEAASPHHGRSGAPLRASRLILFRMYYLGGAEYRAARHLLGISELTWSQWTEEVRTRVGRELLRSGMFPPRRYFREPSARAQPERVA